MKDAEEYMKKAIKVAEASKSRGGVPIGCVMVNREGQIISEGMSLTTPLNDPTCHGEIMAIREAAKKLGTNDLHDLSMYSTLESCGMCMSAALWANIDAIYFGAFAEDVAGNEYEYKDYSSIERSKTSQLWNGSNIEIKGGVLREECVQLMKNYKNWQEVMV